MKNRTYKLVVEVNSSAMVEKSHMEGRLLVTPAIGEDYWTLRVKVSPSQALLVFPKFGVYGCGFAKEIDWNTNLPVGCPVDELWNHIKVNRGRAKEEICIEALKLIRQAAKDYKLFDEAMEARLAR